MGRTTILGLLLVVATSQAAIASLHREPSDSYGGGGIILIVAFFVVAAILSIHSAYKESKAKGRKVAMVVAGITAVAFVFPTLAFVVGGSLFLYSMFMYMKDTIF